MAKDSTWLSLIASHIVAQSQRPRS
jgi:hypothetical protein